MITRKSNLEILEMPVEQLTKEEREEKAFIELELSLNEPITITEEEIMYACVVRGINYYNDEDNDSGGSSYPTLESEIKLLQTLINDWDNIPQLDREIAHYIHGTMPMFHSLCESPFEDYEHISPKITSKNWLQYTKEIINTKPETYDIKPYNSPSF